MRDLHAAPIPTFVVERREDAARIVADEIESLLRARPSSVLGLATGRTPLELYRELASRVRDGRMSFAHATTFNLDEYVGLARDDERRFRAWMQRELFAHVDVAPQRIHFPDEDSEAVASRPEHYDERIEAAGGIDLQLLGVGRSGHVGFNEPGSARTSRTRLVALHDLTRADAAATFAGLEHVPTHAVTMGVATILNARRLRVLAFGAGKADVVRDLLHGPISADRPCTFLREHRDVRLYVDAEAASAL